MCGVPGESSAFVGVHSALLLVSVRESSGFMGCKCRQKKKDLKNFKLRLPAIVWGPREILGFHGVKGPRRMLAFVGVHSALLPAIMRGPVKSSGIRCRFLCGVPGESSGIRCWFLCGVPGESSAFVGVKGPREILWNSLPVSVRGPRKSLDFWGEGSPANACIRWGAY